MKILLVEDDAVAMNLLNGIITGAGFETARANSVEKALSQLQQNPDCDLAIFNLKLPDKDGFALLKILKNSSRFRKLPVIICSRHGDPNSVAKAIQAGAKGFVVKPLSAETLIPKVMELLQAKIKTVLVADDEKTIRDLLGCLLEREGYICKKAEDGEKALKILRRSKVDIVITDIDMPVMNGLELLGHIKKEWQELPVLLITGNGNSKATTGPEAALADGFIIKPFKNTEILCHIREQMQRRTAVSV